VESAESSPGKLHPDHDIERFPCREARKSEGAVRASLEIVPQIEELDLFLWLYPL